LKTNYKIVIFKKVTCKIIFVKTNFKIVVDWLIDWLIGV